MSSSFRLVYWIGLYLIGPSSQILQAPLYLRTLWCYVSRYDLQCVWWDVKPYCTSSFDPNLKF